MSLFKEVYDDGSIEKADIFSYVYGVLHSPEYKQRFSSDLKKQTPRIPFAKSFWAFSKAGKTLLKLHVDYESVSPYPVVENWQADSRNYYVKKMKHPKKNGVQDLTRIIVNEHLTLSDIPEGAYRYVIKGRSAIEWIIKEYAVQEDSKGKSGIVNDPNTYSDDERYIVDLLNKVITISLETMEVVDRLPPLNELKQTDPA